MSKKKGSPGSGRSPSRVIFARVDPDLGAALEEYLDSLRPRPSNTSVVVLALEQYLQRHGFWPRRTPKE